jgi:hypothetical protein
MDLNIIKQKRGRPIGKKYKPYNTKISKSKICNLIRKSELSQTQLNIIFSKLSEIIK